MATLSNPSSTATTKTTQKDQEKEKETSKTYKGTTNPSMTLEPPSPESHNNNNHSNNPPPNALDGPSSPFPPSSNLHTTTLSSNTPADQIGKQPPSHLASTVRKHFNAQQLSEAETVARFAYVVRQSRSGGSVAVEGSDGDGGGWWMGSQGREVRRADSGWGEVGFRVRFRP